MSPSRRASLAPWIVAAVAGAVFVALLVVYYAALVPYRKDHTAGEFTSSEKAAITAASTETANLLVLPSRALRRRLRPGRQRYDRKPAQ